MSTPHFDNQLRDPLPPDRLLPVGFEDFVAADPPSRVAWSELTPFGLDEGKELLPFIRLSDGGIIALWYRTPSPAVVYLGSEGQLRVLAGDFEEFRLAVHTGSQALDLDDAAPPSGSLDALQEEFARWWEEHTALQKPLHGTDSEALRHQVCEIAAKMLLDGRSKVYSLSSLWWSLQFRIELHTEGIRITYLDFGDWYPLPTEYGLVEAVEKLLPLVRHPGQPAYELSVCSAGIVSLDNDRELVLAPA
jgi:hypothetical protein